MEGVSIYEQLREKILRKYYAKKAIDVLQFPALEILNQLISYQFHIRQRHKIGKSRRKNLFIYSCSLYEQHGASQLLKDP